MINFIRRLLGLCVHEWNQWQDVMWLSDDTACQLRVCSKCKHCEYRWKFLRLQEERTDNGK